MERQTGGDKLWGWAGVTGVGIPCMAFSDEISRVLFFVKEFYGLVRADEGARNGGAPRARILKSAPNFQFGCAIPEAVISPRARAFADRRCPTQTPWRAPAAGKAPRSSTSGFAFRRVFPDSAAPVRERDRCALPARAPRPGLRGGPTAECGRI